MKRFLGFLFAAFAVALLSVSCRQVVHDQVRGQVDEMTDSVMVVKIDGEKVTFDIVQCRFTNGAVMYGDSVIINYVGDLSEKIAVAEACYLLVKPSPVIEAVVDSTKELVTRPAEKDAHKEFEKLRKAVENQQKKK